VAELVELIYEMATTNAGGLIRCLYRPNNKPYRAERGVIINGVPHGDRITCGHNPWLYARIVSELEFLEDAEQGIEIARWREPPRFKWKDARRNAVEVDDPGPTRSLERPISRKILDRIPF
jgi:hypothetical protein